MRRAAALILLAGVLAGCGAVKVRTASLHTVRPPGWLRTVVSEETARLGGSGVHGASIRFGRRSDVVQLFGEFTRPRRGTSARLVVSTRTHRLLGAAVGDGIAPTQAFAAARRASRVFTIFRAEPGTVACAIPRGGLSTKTMRLRGRCTTELVAKPLRRGTLRVAFVEHWRNGGRAARGGWIVSVRLADGRVTGIRLTGATPPQLWM